MSSDGRAKGMNALQAAGIGLGTVVGVRRSIYEHYGVMSDCGSVIHYTSPNSDVSGDMRIRETTFEQFLRDGSFCWTMSFPSREEAHRILVRRIGDLAGWLQRNTGISVPLLLVGTGGGFVAEAVLRDYSVRSPHETMNRAKSRLGERRYNLATRNCEHFAFWCATGLSASQQVDGFLSGGATLMEILISAMPVKKVLSSFPSRCSSEWRPLFTRAKTLRFSSSSSEGDAPTGFQVPKMRLKADDEDFFITHALRGWITGRENRP